MTMGPERNDEKAFWERLEAGAREAARGPVPSGLTDRIMAAALSPEPRGLSPWRSAAFAAASLAVGLAIGRLTAPDAGEVRLWLDAPKAREVAVAGDFTGWKPVGLRRRGRRWETAVELPPGRYQYVFIVNGRVFVVDPRAPEIEQDENGTVYSVLDTSDKRL